MFKTFTFSTYYHPCYNIHTLTGHNTEFLQIHVYMYGGDLYHNSVKLVLCHRTSFTCHKTGFIIHVLQHKTSFKKMI